MPLQEVQSCLTSALRDFGERASVLDLFSQCPRTLNKHIFSEREVVENMILRCVQTPAVIHYGRKSIASWDYGRYASVIGRL